MDIEIKDPGKRKGPGCWTYGCLISLVLATAAVTGLYFLAKKAAEIYTTTTPVAVPRAAIPAGTYEAAQKKLDEFKSGLAKQSGPKEVRFSGPELNSLIANSKDLYPLKDRAFIVIDGEIIKATADFPLDEIGLAGRHLTAVGEFSLLLRNGELALSPKKLLINGSSPPPGALVNIEKTKIQASDIKNPESRKMFEAISSIKVENGELVFERKPR